MLDQVLAHLVNTAHAANARGNFDAARSACQQAMQLAPKLPEAWFNLGLAMRGLGQPKEALDAFWQTALLTKGSAEAQNDVGLALMSVGGDAQSQLCFERAISLAPDFPLAHSNLGVLFEKQKRFPEAEACFRRFVELQPQWALAYVHLAGILNVQTRCAEAESVCRKALELEPGLAEAWSNLGAILRGLSCLEESELACRKALELSPLLPKAWSNLALALQGLRRYDEAESACCKALELDPHVVDGWAALGGLFSDQRRYEAAAQAWKKAVELDKRAVGPWMGLSGALFELNRHEEGLACLNEAYSIDPDADYLCGTLLHTKMKLCDWSGFDALLERLFRDIDSDKKASPPFGVLALTDSLRVQYRAAKRWAGDACPEIDDLAPFPKAEAAQKVRLAYFSADFHNHATAHLMAEVFELHDKERFEVIGFSFGPDLRDEMRERLCNAFDRFIDVRNMPDKAVAELARELNVDIAIDLKGYTMDGRPAIFAYRAAPVQISYLGYPGTMAAPCFDYIIADAVLIPEPSQQYYSEKVIYLPDSYQANDSRRQISAREFTRSELGLPEQGFVFCCFNKSYKILPTTFDVWMRILKQVEGSVLWLFEENEIAANNLRKEAQQRGVEGKRLVFAKPMPLSDHLARHRCADLFLDTLPYNAHTTTSDALWAELPVLTCMGESFASRVAGSLLSAVGLPELITSTCSDFEAKAVSLASSPALLAGLKTKLAFNLQSSPLFSSLRFTRNLEASYVEALAHQRSGKAPEHIYVASH